MTDVRFDLEPHQWPPNAQGERLGFADAVFAVDWNGEEVEVAARLVQIGKASAMMFFRARQSSQIYVVATSFGLRLSEQWIRFSSQESRIEIIEERLPKALGSDEFTTYGRLLPFHQRGDDQTNLFVAHDGAIGAWITDSRAGWTQFRARNESDFSLQSLPHPDSPAGFALQWSRLSHTQQVERALCFANGDWQEFQETVRAAVYFGAPSLAKTGMIISFNGEFAIGDKAAPFYRHSVHDTGVRLRRWAVYIQKHFAPYRDEQLAVQHLCVAEQSLSPFIQFELPQPSQHERLEAALTLRAWAKDKIPAREARLLLRKI